MDTSTFTRRQGLGQSADNKKIGRLLGSQSPALGGGPDGLEIYIEPLKL
ncbi:hypothetical protein MES5069_390029 [Mesorhizobium escarrei]|uniref:Uncharacterized protein n=1 Tax=Mesorhizobium escarrei TaxID=666018 RepID=A0ABM9E382_9HYPH|nr:hypothetical protein MES5069_390029 [Mesorhizobium escarrei]